jgi:flagellar protein FliL
MKKKLIFILLPLLLLGGGGAGAWFFFFSAPAEGEQAAAAEHPAAAEEAEGGHGGGEGGHGGAPEAVFVDVGELIVPVYNRDGQDNFMVVRMELEIGEAMSADEVRYLLPRLRDAYIGTLSTMAGRGELVEESRRAATIKRALKLTSDRVLGPDAVKDVLLQRAWQQPM